VVLVVAAQHFQSTTESHATRYSTNLWGHHHKASEENDTLGGKCIEAVVVIVQNNARSQAVPLQRLDGSSQNTVSRFTQKND